MNKKFSISIPLNYESFVNFLNETLNKEQKQEFLEFCKFQYEILDNKTYNINNVFEICFNDKRNKTITDNYLEIIANIIMFSKKYNDYKITSGFNNHYKKTEKEILIKFRKK